ncbi:MAG: endonuclease/exonuclease/phosphatase family protein [Chitinophagaceae bacterium]|jgi:endonuclease/exonuclease/phosphatase family metal-dependent hydrolase|nr:endonuclease/exonuclease/phosphatase family protein [Chitinophagaceae bacterium]OQY92521.1 MAG: endonuclease/exonuclease/phosphatase [Sphingobacteriales bacterium UTBCD1]
MKGNVRIWVRKFLIYANIIVGILFLLACFAAPHLDPTQWWPISLLALAFPFLLFFMLAFLTGWLFVKPKHAVFPAILLLAGYKSISVFFAFHFASSFHQEKEPHSVRIASWNVARFIELRKNNNKGSQARLKMMDQIEEINADILCFQEFQTSANPDYYDNIDYIRRHLNYPYFYFSYDEDGELQYYSSIIFSRFPIVDSGRLYYPHPTLPEVLLHADIKINEDTIRVFSTHLQSLQFKKSDYDKISSIERVRQDSLISNSRTIFSKLKRGVINRSIQARIARDELRKSTHPVLFCGDLNDVPNSYTYTTVRGDMQDAFLKKSRGIGRTFNSLSPTLRIDYIFAGNNFRIQQFNRLVKDLSDHYMLVADVALKSPKYVVH